MFGHHPDEPWARYAERLDEQRRGVDLALGRVPATFLLAVVGEQIVGRASVRHELNESLAAFGGHIGYGVLPGFRGRGHATEMLRQSLVIARAVGIDRVLVTCDEHNGASARVIEHCDGVFESIVDQTGGGPRKRRYWID